MSIIAVLENQYRDIDNKLYSREFAAIGDGNEEDEKDCRYKRELNSHAYFLFLFTRLEDHIRKQSKILFTNKLASETNWRQRAIWDISNHDDLHFKKMVALLTEKGKKNYNTIIEYYDIRNQIGHGETIEDFIKKVNMSSVFEDMKKLLVQVVA